MTQTYGPFAAGAGSSLGQDPYLDTLGPMLQGDGVNSTSFGGAALQVYGNSSGLQVLMRAGSALIRGVMYQNTADVTLVIAPNGSGSTRIDRVVLRNDRAHAGGGQIYPFVITGTPGAGAPAITQTVGGTWDITLAQVTVTPSSGGIAPGNVTDERQYLPLHVKVCDTSISTPPVDGSTGRVFYDKNPAVGDLIVTDGASWGAVTQRDTGVVGVALTPQWAYDTVAPQVQRYGRHVDFRMSVQLGSGGYNHIVATLPVGCRPAVPRAWLISVQNVGTAGDYSTGHAEMIIGSDGNVLIEVASINLRQSDGTSGTLFTTTRFEASVMFTAA